MSPSDHDWDDPAAARREESATAAGERPTMLPSAEVPLELWCAIFALCAPPDVTLVCKKWTSIAHSIPVLWSEVYIRDTPGSPDTLDLHLTRARNHPLHLFIRSRLATGFAVLQIVKSGSTISAVDVRLDNLPVLDPLICSPSKVSLLRLTVHEDGFDPPDNSESDLAIILINAPMLRSLFLPDFPLVIPPPYLRHLTTLVIERSFEASFSGPYPICSLLLGTPNLETFHYKTPDIWSWFNVHGIDTLSSLSDQEQPIHLPILLPRLTSVAVTVTGEGGDILTCINAPALRDLHLDGSRSNMLSELEWSSLLHTQFLDTIQQTAARSPGLRRLAITEATLSESTWLWLLCGQPIFPDLETLAIRDFSKTRSCGLDDAVLTAFAASPGLTALKRLVLRRCFAFQGDSLLSALRSICDKTRKSTLDLELDLVDCRGIQESHIVAMQELGVRVRWVADTDNLVVEARRAQLAWWEHNEDVVREELAFSKADWEQEDVRDEKPWWISDLGDLDPSDSWVF